MLVKDIMTCSVKTVTPATSILEVVSLMCLYRYSGLPAYHQAKHRIFRGARQVVVNRDDLLSRPLPVECVAVWTFGLGQPDFRGFGLRDEAGERCLAFQFEALMPVRELKVRGAHNQSNALAALALGHAVGLPFEAMLETLRAGLREPALAPAR